MAKPATFSPIFAMAHLFRSNAGHSRRVSDCCTLAVMVTGRKAKNNAETVAAVQPLIDAGLARTQVLSFAPKGCPGGKARPAIVYVMHLELTDAGMAAVAEQYPAVDAWRAEVDAAQRARLLAEITTNLAKVSAEQAASARVAGELPGKLHEGPTVEALQAAPMRNLINVWHVLRVAVSRLPR
jgi:hypothetical protein